MQTNQAEADLQWPWPRPPPARRMAAAREQEMRALVEENRAKVVLAEAEVPLAIAQAFRDGRLGVMDYYNLQNVQSDTDMRRSIAGSGAGGGVNSDRTERMGN